MSSKESKLKNLLYDIMSDVNSNRFTREEVFTRCVTNKLEAVRHNYNKQMTNLYKYILTRSNIKTIKAINKLKKEDEDE